MTDAEASRAGEVLTLLADRRNRNLLDWLALVEDRLRTILPADSQLFARFQSVKAQWAPNSENTARQSERIEQECRGIVLAARDFVTTLNTDPAPKPDLEQEVHHIIQKGYFQSWPFRFVVGALAVLGTLITGVAGLRLYEYVQRAQKLVDDARAQVEESRKEIAQAQYEITNKRAELALLVLQGNQDLFTMRVNAVSALEDSKRNYLQELEVKKKQLVVSLDDAATKDIKIVDEQVTRLRADVQRTADDGQKQLADKVRVAIMGLSPSTSPWVPIVVWTGARWWLAVLLMVGLSLSAWFVSAIVLFDVGQRIATLTLAANVVLLTIMTVVIYWRA